MKNLFIPYELAIIAKEKGFDERCFSNYGMPTICPAPLYHQIINWLREKHNIVIEIQLDQTSYIKFCIKITKWNCVGDFEIIDVPLEKWGLYRDYNEALKVAIEEALKTIK